MITRKIWITVLLIAAFVMLAFPAANAEVNMDAFVDDVVTLQSQYDINASWTAENAERFVSLLKQYDLYERDGVPVDSAEWAFFSGALRYAYEQAWGDDRQWDLAQQYAYAVVEQEIGIDDTLLESFPGEGDLTLDEARELAQDKIRAMGETLGYDGDDVDFSAMIEEYHFWDYNDGDVDHTWVFAYYTEGIDAAIYRVMLYDNGARPNVDYYDVDSMYNIYARWRAERGYQNFFDWSVEDKYAFNEVLLSVYDHQMNTYGELTTTAKFVFGYRYVLAEEGMIDQEEAIDAAKGALLNQAGLSLETINEMRVGVFLYNNDDNQVVYGIGFAVDHSMLYMVEVDAYNALILSIGD